MIPKILFLEDTIEIIYPINQKYVGWNPILELKQNNETVHISGNIDNLFWKFSAQPITTLSSGLCYWVVRVELSGKLKTLDVGTTQLMSINNPNESWTNHWKKIREAAVATLQGRATEAHKSLSVGDKSISLMTYKELIELIDYCNIQIYKNSPNHKRYKRIRFVS